MTSSEDTVRKTVLCVFKERRRPVTFEASTDEKMEKNNLLEAIKKSFSDVLQTESSKWGLIYLTGCVEESAIIHLCYSTSVTVSAIEVVECYSETNQPYSYNHSCQVSNSIFNH